MSLIEKALNVVAPMTNAIRKWRGGTNATDSDREHTQVKKRRRVVTIDDEEEEDEEEEQQLGGDDDDNDSDYQDPSGVKHNGDGSGGGGVEALDVDEEADCCVCFNGDSEWGNEIIFCDGCNIAVHQACYGVGQIPEGDWFCRRCEKGVENVKCVLCPFTDGAFKQTENNEWVHVTCGVWIPEVDFDDVHNLENLVNVHQVLPARFKMQCSVCGKRNGACIQCSKTKCRVAFHPICAFKNKYRMEVKDARSHRGDVQPGNYAKLAYCPKHKDAVSQATVHVKPNGEPVIVVTDVRKKSTKVPPPTVVDEVRSLNKPVGPLSSSTTPHIDLTRTEPHTVVDKSGTSFMKSNTVCAVDETGVMSPTTTTEARKNETMKDEKRQGFLPVDSDDDGDPHGWWDETEHLWFRGIRPHEQRCIQQYDFSLHQDDPAFFMPPLGTVSDGDREHSMEFPSSVAMLGVQPLPPMDDENGDDKPGVGAVTLSTEDEYTANGPAAFFWSGGDGSSNDTTSNKITTRESQWLNSVPLEILVYFANGSQRRGAMCEARMSRTATVGADIPKVEMEVTKFRSIASATVVDKQCTHLENNGTHNDCKICEVYTTPMRMHDVIVEAETPTDRPIDDSAASNSKKFGTVEDGTNSRTTSTHENDVAKDDGKAVGDSDKQQSQLRPPLSLSIPAQEAPVPATVPTIGETLSQQEAPPPPAAPAAESPPTLPPPPRISCGHVIIEDELRALQCQLISTTLSNNEYRERLRNILSTVDVNEWSHERMHKSSCIEAETINRYLHSSAWQILRLSLFRGVSDLPYISRVDGVEDTNDYSVCCVCFDGESSEINPIVFCDTCNISVHKYCYGIEDIPEEEWFCDRCTTQGGRGGGGTVRDNDPYVCQLCPMKGGALKRTTKDNGWAHIVCALWCEKARINNVTTMSRIGGIDKAVSASDHVCSICGLSYGACIKCADATCQSAFHPLCGWYGGLFMSVLPGDKMKAKCALYCQRHTPTGERDRVVGLQKEMRCRGLQDFNSRHKLRQRNLRRMQRLKQDIYEPGRCAVCFESEISNETNAMLHCERCEIDVHCKCYGVVNRPIVGAKWKCDRCNRRAENKDASCCLCPRKGGAMKATTNGRWAHVVCAEWLPETSFTHNDFKSRITGIEAVNDKRRKLRCYLCRRVQGACIQCSDHSCYDSFHPLCAMFAGTYMCIKNTSQYGIVHIACCRRHTPLNLARGLRLPHAYVKMLALRHDLDRVRTLVDLSRRREKMRKQHMDVSNELVNKEWKMVMDKSQAEIDALLRPPTPTPPPSPIATRVRSRNIALVNVADHESSNESESQEDENVVKKASSPRMSHRDLLALKYEGRRRSSRLKGKQQQHGADDDVDDVSDDHDADFEVDDDPVVTAMELSLSLTDDRRLSGEHEIVPYVYQRIRVGSVRYSTRRSLQRAASEGDQLHPPLLVVLKRVPKLRRSPRNTESSAAPKRKFVESDVQHVVERVTPDKKKKESTAQQQKRKKVKSNTKSARRDRRDRARTRARENRRRKTTSNVKRSKSAAVRVKRAVPTRPRVLRSRLRSSKKREPSPSPSSSSSSDDHIVPPPRRVSPRRQRNTTTTVEAAPKTDAKRRKTVEDTKVELVPSKAKPKRKRSRARSSRARKRRQRPTSKATPARKRIRRKWTGEIVVGERRSSRLQHLEEKKESDDVKGNDEEESGVKSDDDDNDGDASAVDAETRQDTDNNEDSGSSDGNDNDGEYAVGGDCEIDGFRCRILKEKVVNGITKFRIHFHNWHKRYDKWVTVEEMSPYEEDE